MAVNHQNYYVLGIPAVSDTSFIKTDGSPALNSTYNTSLMISPGLKHTFMFEEGVIHSSRTHN